MTTFLYVSELDDLYDKCRVYNLDIDDESIVMDLLVKQIRELEDNESINILKVER